MKRMVSKARAAVLASIAAAVLFTTPARAAEAPLRAERTLFAGFALLQGGGSLALVATADPNLRFALLSRRRGEMPRVIGFDCVETFSVGDPNIRLGRGAALFASAFFVGDPGLRILLAIFDQGAPLSSRLLEPDEVGVGDPEVVPPSEGLCGAGNVSIAPVMAGEFVNLVTDR